MSRTLALILALGVGATGSALAQSATEGDAALDLAGLYDFEAVQPDRTIEGRMKITGAPGDYEGTMAADGESPVPITRFAIEGNVVEMTIATDDGGEVITSVTFEGGSFAGTFSGSRGNGTLTGKKLPR